MKFFLFFALIAQAIRIDDHADALSDLSALIKQIKQKPAQKKSQNNDKAVGVTVPQIQKQSHTFGNTTHFDNDKVDKVGPILSQVTESAEVAVAGVDVGEKVEFTGFNNMEYTAGTLTKNAGLSGLWDAGAFSVGSFDANSNVNGVQFRPMQTDKNLMIGLSNGNTDSSEMDIDFAVYAVDNGAFYVYENGFSQGRYGAYATNDKITVEVNSQSGKIEYMVNDDIRYTSTKTPTYPLGVDVSFLEKSSNAAKDIKWVGRGDNGDMHVAIKDLLGDIKVSITEEKNTAIQDALGECTDLVDENLKLENVVDFTDVTKVEGDATQYTDLIGCGSASDCETKTEIEQTKAINAHDEIIRLEGQLDAWEADKATGQNNLKSNKDKKEALEQKKITHQGLHEKRMDKFTDAITILKRIDDALEDSGKIVAPASSLVSQEEKKVIQEVSTVGHAILMMVDQATTAAAGGDNESDLVQTLKNLLQTCIGKLDGSKSREILAHDKWIEGIDAEIETLETEIGRIGGVITDLTAKIAENKRLIGEETTKKADAITESNTLRGVCVTRHNLFTANMIDFASELDAIETMFEILEEAGLDAKTIEIRDEDESTKHGVMESIGGSGEPNYYVTGLNGICPTDDMVTTEEECVSAMLAVTNPNPTPMGKGLSYTSPTGWGGYPPNCFYEQQGGLHWAGNRPQNGNTPRSDVYAICNGV